MSRKNGVFPQYKTTALDPNSPPSNFFDSCRKCSSCGLRWPNTNDFNPGPCCGKNTWVENGTAPEITWREAVSSLKHSNFDKAYEEWDSNTTDEALMYYESDNPISDDNMESQARSELEQILNEINETRSY